jgi:hypothetical protein
VFSPTARTTPTRMPWWWPVMVGWLLLALWAPVFATPADDAAAKPLPLRASEPSHRGGWQLVGTEQMLQALRHRRDSGAPRLLPLAVMPTQHGAWWFGVAASRTSGARVELRWTLPLDGRPAWRAPHDD